MMLHPVLMLAVAALLAASAGAVHHAEAHIGQAEYPDGNHYEGIHPEFSDSGIPNCSIARDITSTARLPEYVLLNPLEATETASVCPDLFNRYRQFVLVYKIEDGADPHPVTLRHDFANPDAAPRTIDFGDPELGTGNYEIYYFSQRITPTGDHPGAMHAFARISYDAREDPPDIHTANMTIAPPPPVFTSPPNGTQFSPIYDNAVKIVSGTASTNVNVILNVTGPDAGQENSYTIFNGANPDWDQFVTLFPGENRLAAVAMLNSGIRSDPAVIFLHLVDRPDVIMAPVITHPADGTRFAFDEREQAVNGTHDDSTVRLRVAHIVNGSVADDKTYSEGTDNSTHWSRDVVLFEGENRLTAVASRGTANSISSSPVTVTVEPEQQDVCSINIVPDLELGTLTNGATSRDGTLAFENTGSLASRHMLHGTHWVNPEDTAGRIMDVAQTRYHDTANTAYADKTELTGRSADALAGLQPGASGSLYLQTRVDLDRPDYAGALQQKITVSTSCG